MSRKPCVDCQGNSITPQEAEAGWTEGVCDVCRILRKDETMKQIKHCDFCNADICELCTTKYGNRILAAVIETFNFKTKVIR